MPSPDPRGHYGASLSRMSDVSENTVGSTLAWMRARGMVMDVVTDVQPETPRATRGPPAGPKYVRLTDDGRWYFERRRERLFLTEFESVSPAPLFPFTARQPRDLGPPPDADFERRAVAWEDEERQAREQVSEMRRRLWVDTITRHQQLREERIRQRAAAQAARDAAQAARDALPRPRSLAVRVVRRKRVKTVRRSHR